MKTAILDALIADALMANSRQTYSHQKSIVLIMQLSRLPNRLKLSIILNERCIPKFDQVA